MKTKALLFLTLTIFISCEFFGDRVDKEKLPGRYVFQIDNGDTLDVYSNGTYSYYTWSYGKKLQNSGTWTHNSGMGEVDFQDFSFLTNSTNIGDSTFVPRGTWITRIETKENQIRFIYASDVYKGYFLKVDTVDNNNVE